MKVFLIGHRGWIGTQFMGVFSTKGIEVIYSEKRAEDPALLTDILTSSATHVLCCVGRTHGTRDGVTYTTIDYLEHPTALCENLNDNLFVPVTLALFCDSHKLHFTYLGTGCIFEYDAEHEMPRMGTSNEVIGFSEDDVPNFFGSNYSIVKGFTDRIFHTIPSALNLRIRMPITSHDNPRNFISKIIRYKKICSLPNSMTVLDELIPAAAEMMSARVVGTYNLTNPGTITHNEILFMYRDIVDPTFTWENFTPEEQSKILLSRRSNNFLDTTKLEAVFGRSDMVRSIQDAVKSCLENWKTGTTAGPVTE
jgi:dTDP-4-dehydrorhamnose reductase